MTEERNRAKENDPPSTNFQNNPKQLLAAFGAGALIGAIGAGAYKLLNQEKQSPPNKNTESTMAKDGKAKSTNASPAPTHTKTKVQNPPTPQNPGTKKEKVPNPEPASQKPKKVQPQLQPTPKTNEKKATPPTNNQNQKSSGKASAAQVPKPTPIPQNKSKKSHSPSPSTSGSVNNKYEGRASPTPSVSSAGSIQSQRSKASARDCCTVYDNGNDNIIIAIDATKDFAGGILILPNTREIFYYCIKWSKIFDFPKTPGSEIPEVANAALAFELFDRRIRHYKRTHAGSGRTEVMVKTKKSLANVNGYGNKLFSNVDSKLKMKLQGSWQKTSDDEALTTAFRLSRGEAKLNVPALLNLPMYKGINISTAEFAVVHALAISIPNQVIST